jgi:hypothetical protein
MDLPTIPRHSRLRPIPDLREWYTDLHFGGRSDLVSRGEPIFVTDPIYLADVFNPSSDPVVDYLREHGVIVTGFGGDAACPVWWCEPYLLLPVSMHYEEVRKPDEAIELATEIGCDSGSFIFILMSSNLPDPLRERIQSVGEERNGAILRIPQGTYTWYLEQFEPRDKETKHPNLYRNVVAQRL